MRTSEDLKAYLTEFYGKQAIDSNSYWIPLKIYYVDDNPLKILVHMGNENNQVKEMHLEILDRVPMEFKESLENYNSRRLTLKWEENEE